MAYTGGMKAPALLQWLWSRKGQAFGVSEQAAYPGDHAGKAARIAGCASGHPPLAHISW